MNSFNAHNRKFIPNEIIIKNITPALEMPVLELKTY